MTHIVDSLLARLLYSRCAATTRMDAPFATNGDRSVAIHLINNNGSNPAQHENANDGRLFLASGIGPNCEGDDTIFALAPSGPIQKSRLVTDPELSPLDLAIAPNGNIVVSNEYPFGASSAVTTVCL